MIDFKKKDFASKRNFILVGLTILILSVTVFRQTIINTIKLVEENRQKREKAADLTKKANYLEELDTGELEDSVGQLEQVFPSKKPVLELVNTLKILASEDEVSLGAITLTPGRVAEMTASPEKVEKKEFEETKMEDFFITFVINGEYEKASKFIKDLERATPILSIENLQVSYGRPEERLILGVTLGVRVHWQKAPEAIPPLEMPVAHLTAQEEKILDELALFKYYPIKAVAGVTQGKENLFEKPL